MTNPQAAVIHKIDRGAGINATIDGLTTTLSQSPPTPTPPKVIGLTAILLAAVDPASCYGVALFDTADHAKAATGAFTTYWKTNAHLGAAVHEPVVAATVIPGARMVWAEPVAPVAVHMLGLLDGLHWALGSAIRRIRQSQLAQPDPQSDQDGGPVGQPNPLSDQDGGPVGQPNPPLAQPDPAPTESR
jgi:hypothetical protein